MKILVLSDSHAGLSFMRRCVEKIKPDAIVHLGDYFDDAGVLSEEFPHIPVHAVPGNCDRYRLLRSVPEILCYDVCGVRLFMTHGHKHGVKTNTAMLIGEARAMHAQAALYGHTHVAECRREEDGMWVLNPGTSGYGGGSAGLIEVQDNAICSCRIITSENLEEFV